MRRKASDLTAAIQKAPTVSGGVLRAARLCSSSQRPHVYPLLVSLLPLQLPHSCTSCVLHPQRFGLGSDQENNSHEDAERSAQSTMVASSLH